MPLNPLREKIDQVDRELIALLSERLRLVAKVGKVKSEHGIPVYAPEREKAMIDARCLEAEKLGVPANLIEDVLRRVMRESYANENKHGFNRFLSLSGYQVVSLDQNDWAQADTILAGADLVLVCVPINKTLETIERLQPFLTEKMILADLTSVKAQPLQKMLQVHQGAVVGFHPMFGPDTPSLAKQVVVCCHGRGAEQYEWLLEQIKIWGAKIEVIDAIEHDHAMTYIQALRHFSTFMFGLHLSEQPIKLEQLLALSSPIYRLELAMIGRLFAQDGALYADIISDKPENLTTIQSLKATFEQSLKFFEEKDKAGFIQVFEKVHHWFGDYSEQFLKESQVLLQQANDYRK